MHIQIVNGNKSDWWIVTDNDPSPSVELAASELQKYIGLATGADLAVVPVGETEPGRRILVGQSEVASGSAAATVGQDLSALDLGDEGFLIRSVGDDILLAGQTGVGALYAAYEFIERFLGVRWFDRPIGEVVPKTDALEVPDIDIVEKPAFPIRGADIHTVTDEEEFLDCLDWMGKNRVNWVLVFLEQDELVREFLPELEKRSIHVNIGGHSLHNFVYDLVRLDPIEDREECVRRRRQLFNEHPEWHSLIGGWRFLCREREGHVCFTNPGVAEHVARNVIAYLKQAPYVDIVSIWGEDSEGNYCECSECMRIGKEDAMLLFINRVAKQVAEVRPDVLVETVAYSDFVRPPERERLEPNVITLFAPWDRDYHTPFDSEHWKNKRYAKHLRAWADTPRVDGGKSQVYLFEYYKYSNAPKSLTIQADARQIRDMGLAGVVEGCPFWDHQPSALFASYFLYKFLWNPDRDGQTLREDAIRSAFPGMEEAVTKCLDALEEVLPAGRYAIRHWRKLWQTPAELLKNTLAHHRKAVEVVEQWCERMKELRSAAKEAEVAERLAQIHDILAATGEHLRPLILHIEAMQLVQQTRGPQRQEGAMEQAKAKLTEALSLAGKQPADYDDEAMAEMVAYFDLPADLIRLIVPLDGKSTPERIAQLRRRPHYRSCLRDKAKYGCQDCVNLECMDFAQDDQYNLYRLEGEETA